MSLYSDIHYHMKNLFSLFEYFSLSRFGARNRGRPYFILQERVKTSSLADDPIDHPNQGHGVLQLELVD